MRLPTTARFLSAALLLPLVAACSDSNSTGVVTPVTPTITRTYQQVERLGNPLVSEVFFAKRDHGLANTTAPATDIANGFDTKIKTFPNTLFVRGLGFTERDFFEVPDSAAIAEPPRVQF